MREENVEWDEKAAGYVAVVGELERVDLEDAPVSFLRYRWGYVGL